MKLIIIPHLPSFQTRGYQIAKNLAKHNEVHFIMWEMFYPINFNNLKNCIMNCMNYHISKSENIYIHKIKRLPFFFPIINKPLFKYQIKKIFNNVEADVIISETYTNETEPPLELPFIYDIVDDHQAYADSYGSPIYKLAFRILNVKKTIENQIKHAKAVTVVSDNLFNSIKNKTKYCYKVPNGVETEIFSTRYKSKRNNKKISLLYLSNFGKWSNLPYLFKVMQLLKQEKIDYNLILVGNGSEISNSKKIARKLKIYDNITYMGKINDRSKIYEIINSSDICLNISEKNKFRDAASPIKLFEYSALGKKVISTELDEVKSLGFPNVIFFKNDGNPLSLLSAIKNAFTMKIDIKRTKSVVSKYDIAKIVKQFEQIIILRILKDEK